MQRKTRVETVVDEPVRDAVRVEETDMRAAFLDAKQPVVSQVVFQEQLVVSWSDGEDESSEEEFDDVVARGRPKLSRQQLIENMKIRIVQLGKCPSTLLAKSSEKPVVPTANIAEKAAVPVVSVPHASTPPEENAKRSPCGGGKECVVESPTNVVMPDVHSCGVVDDICPNDLSSPPKHVVREGPKPTVQSPDQSSASLKGTLSDMDACKDISLLRRRIAKLERQRDTRKVALKKMSDVGSPVQRKDVAASKNVTVASSQGHDRPVGSATRPLKRVRSSDAVVRSTSVLAVQDRGRYYSSEAKKIDRVPSPDRPSRDGSTSPGSEVASAVVERGAWNRREGSVPTAASAVPDRAQAGLVDDLKTELETSKRQLDTVQDYTQLAYAADVSVAQALTKVAFKRQRVRQIEADLKRAQFELDDAEQDYDKIENAAKRLRASLGELPFSEHLPPIREISRASNTAPAVDTNYDKASDARQSCLRTGTTPADQQDADLDTPRSRGPDLILQPSPYTPTPGCAFSSCLRVLRAYASAANVFLLWSASEVLFGVNLTNHASLFVCRDVGLYCEFRYILNRWRGGRLVRCP